MEYTMSRFVKKLVTISASVAMLASSFASFGVAHAAVMAGEVYKTTDGTVWFVTNDSPMQKRPFTSWGAFLSYGFLSAGPIKDATAEVSAVTSGAFVPPQDGTRSE